jgi:DNA ligase (NAD+)
MDIENLGEKRVVQLLDAGLVRDAGDIYSLTYDQLIGLEGFADLSVRNLLSAIERSKERPLANLLFGMQIPMLGYTGAERLATAMGDLDRIVAASEEELAAVDGIGPKIAHSVRAFLDLDRNQEVVEKLRRAGVNFVSVSEAPDLPQTVAGKAIVVTGTLSTMSREAAIDAIKARGGTSPGSVSKKTSFLVVGAEPGSAKLTKAQELGVPVVEEDGFARLLETGEA